MRKFNTILLLLLLATSMVQATQLDSLFVVLDGVIDSVDVYTARRRGRIGRVKEARLRLKGNESGRYQTDIHLGEEYSSFICDSASFYLSESIILAQEMNDVFLENESKIRLAHHLASSGIYEVSLDMLESVNKAGLTPEQRLDYFIAMDHVYGEMSIGKYTGQFAWFNYAAKSKAYKDSIYACIDKTDLRYLEMEENRLRDAMELDSAMMINDLRLSQTEPDSPDYAVVMFQRSLVHKLERDTVAQMECLCRSAITDIRQATKDHASLWHLADLLMTCDDLDRAARYMKFSWSETNIYDSPLRNLQSASIQSFIESRYQEQILESNRKLKLIIGIVLTMVVLMILSVMYIYRQKKKVNAAHKELQTVNHRLKQLNDELNDVNRELLHTNQLLSESDSIKEVYISRFIRLCSEYVERLDKLRITVNKKLSAGKTSEVVALTRSSKITDEAVDLLYENFDAAFLRIFPDFVEQFNELLLEEERIVLKNKERLNIELRIFALIRLGFSDSGQIAEFLRYSPNTIYNYRAKVKNKSKCSRVEFENFVRAIR